MKNSDQSKTSHLTIDEVSVSFLSKGEYAYAVTKISLELQKGECLAIVGESGSGKTAFAMALLRLILQPPGRIEGKGVYFQGHNLLKSSQEVLREIRGKHIAMVFQEPMTALNPVLRCGVQVDESVRRIVPAKNGNVRQRTIHLFQEVGLPDPERVYTAYPHTLSGGMRQRVLIAMALACNPQVLIADEPTTALDVTIQAQIIQLFQNLRRHREMTLLFITHDLGLVAQIADRIAVMYAGRIQETAPARELLQHPLHPYTKLLLECKPSAMQAGNRLTVIPGMAPSITEQIAGCPFHPRCPLAEDVCRKDEPALKTYNEYREIRCWKVI